MPPYANVYDDPRCVLNPLYAALSRHVRLSRVSSQPQSGKGGGRGPVPAKSIDSVRTGSAMLIMPSSFASHASKHHQGIHGSLNSQYSVWIGSAMSMRPSPFASPRRKRREQSSNAPWSMPAPQGRRRPSMSSGGAPSDVPASMHGESPRRLYRPASTM